MTQPGRKKIKASECRLKIVPAAEIHRLEDALLITINLLIYIIQSKCATQGTMSGVQQTGPTVYILRGQVHYYLYKDELFNLLVIR